MELHRLMIFTSKKVLSKWFWFRAFRIDDFTLLYLHPERPLIMRLDVFSPKAVQEISLEKALQLLKEKGYGIQTESCKGKEDNKPIR